MTRPTPATQFSSTRVDDVVSEAEQLLKQWSRDIVVHPTSTILEEDVPAVRSTLEDLAMDDAKTFIDALMRKEIKMFVNVSIDTSTITPFVMLGLALPVQSKVLTHLWRCRRDSKKCRKPRRNGSLS